MEVTLPADVAKQLEEEVSSGRFSAADELIAEAIRQFLGERRRATARIEALRRIGQAVDEAGLYDTLVTVEK